MNKMTDRSKFVAKPFIQYKTNNVLIYPCSYRPLSDAEERALNAFNKLYKENGKFPLTAHIAKELNKNNKTWVHDLMNRLVCDGYVCCYLCRGKRFWCDRETAEKMDKALKQSAQSGAYR